MKLSNESIEKILKFIEDNNIPNGLSAEDLHTTVIYSTKPAKVELYDVKNVVGTFVRFSKFGEDKNVLVMEVACKPLEKLHDYYMEKYPLSWNWPEYKPHITLSYDASTVDETKLIWPADSIIIFCAQYQEPLDLEWKK